MLYPKGDTQYLPRCTYACEDDFETGDLVYYQCLRHEGHDGYHVINGHFGYPAPEISLENVFQEVTKPL